MKRILCSRWWAATVAGLVLGSIGWFATANESSNSNGKKIDPPRETPEIERAIESANSLSTAFRSVADRLLPAVVAIENRPQVAWKNSAHTQPSQQKVPDVFGGENPFRGSPFEELFKDRSFKMMPPRDQAIPRPSPGGIGSGVIIDPSGVILTNNHVVAGGGEVTVRTFDGSEYLASQVWTDEKTDLAVVKIEGAGALSAASLGDSDEVQIGDWVLALGQPFGLESTVTAGIISAKNRGLGITARENFLQTDAAINPGNSGGPLVNLRGEVIGINTAISSRSGGNDGIGFAVPANLARWVSDQLASNGEVKRAYLGVGIQPIDQEIGRKLQVKARSGVVVTEVFPTTPAAEAGFKSGDVIVAFDGQKIRSPRQLQLVVERVAMGSKVPVNIVRDGKNLTLDFSPVEQPGDFGTPRKPNSSLSERCKEFGLEVAPLTDDVAERLSFPDVEGVVVTSVLEGSSAAKAGLKPGTVISQVDGQSVENMEEFSSALEKGSNGKGILLLVRTANGSRFVVLK